ncbi:MAG: hypothetical protein LBP87_03290, partial [Planctomycetaceae bacterium]|nr:hypothetical protein [Planctomycetaceae bacterium]
MLLYAIVFSWFLVIGLWFWGDVRRSLVYWFCSPKNIGTNIAVLLERHFRKSQYDDLDIFSYVLFKRMSIVVYQELQNLFAEKNVECVVGIGDIDDSITMVDCITRHSVVPLTFIKSGSVDFECSQHLSNGLWLWRENGIPMALLLSGDKYERVWVEICVIRNSPAVAEAERMIKHLQQHCTSPLGEPVVSELRQHFGNIEPDDIFIVSREFPCRIQIELYQEIEKILATKKIIRAGGLELDHNGTVLMNNCLVEQDKRLIPLEYIEIDIGEDTPAKCVKCGFW